MKYNRPHATAKWGTMATDWEAGVNFPRLIEDRFQKAQAAVKASGLGAYWSLTLTTSVTLPGLTSGSGAGIK